jgi:hypothetical protein
MEAGVMDFLKNVAINLRATGIAAVMITWLLCFTALCLFGNSGLAAAGVGILSTIGVMLFAAIGRMPAVDQ